METEYFENGDHWSDVIGTENFFLLRCDVSSAEKINSTVTRKSLINHSNRSICKQFSNDVTSSSNYYDLILNFYYYYFFFTTKTKQFWFVNNNGVNIYRGISVFGLAAMAIEFEFCVNISYVDCGYRHLQMERNTGQIWLAKYRKCQQPTIKSGKKCICTLCTDAWLYQKWSERSWKKRYRWRKWWKKCWLFEKRSVSGLDFPRWFQFNRAFVVCASNICRD